MIIQIDPSRIRSSSGTAARSNDRRRQTESEAPIVTPKRADENHIPAPESLRTLINSAVVALKRGIRWDRGTILNVVV